MDRSRVRRGEWRFVPWARATPAPASRSRPKPRPPGNRSRMSNRRCCRSTGRYQRPLKPTERAKSTQARCGRWRPSVELTRRGLVERGDEGSRGPRRLRRTRHPASGGVGRGSGRHISDVAIRVLEAHARTFFAPRRTKRSSADPGLTILPTTCSSSSPISHQDAVGCETKRSARRDFAGVSTGL